MSKKTLAAKKLFPVDTVTVSMARAASKGVAKHRAPKPGLPYPVKDGEPLSLNDARDHVGVKANDDVDWFSHPFDPGFCGACD